MVPRLANARSSVLAGDLRMDCEVTMGGSQDLEQFMNRGHAPDKNMCIPSASLTIGVLNSI